MRVCDICGKGTTFGHNVSHSNRKTNRKWLPNLQYKKINIDGAETRVRLCTRCLRSKTKIKAKKS
ncbi:50S ribosomal protein L28 [bacterium CG2_30_33_46]|nr:MAG: 50S ribosomal protein L28 [bacterium CG2_30_33_46]